MTSLRPLYFTSLCPILQAKVNRTLQMIHQWHQSSGGAGGPAARVPGGGGADDARFEVDGLQIGLDAARANLLQLLEVVPAERTWASLLPEVVHAALKLLCQVRPHWGAVHPLGM